MQSNFLKKKEYSICKTGYVQKKLGVKCLSFLKI